MTLRYIISPGATNEKVLTEADIISHNPVRTHTGLSDLSATIIEDRTLDSYAQRQDRLNVEVNGSVKWTGYVVGLSHNIGQGRSRLRAEGIAKRLKETRPNYETIGGSVTYNSTPIDEALRDYWARTPFDNYNVVDEPVDVVDTDDVIQSADLDEDFKEITSISLTDPIVCDNSTIGLAQTLFFGDTDELGGGTDIAEDPNLTDNNWDDADAWEYDNSGDESLPVTFTFTPNYTIPAEHVGVLVRTQGEFSNGIVATLNGNLVIQTGVFAGEANPTWYALNSDSSNLSGSFTDIDFDDNRYTGDDLSAGNSYTLTYGPAGDPTGGNTAYIDCVCVYDDRFSYTVDNNIDSTSLELDGPELYPPSFDILLDERRAGYNITEAAVTTTIDDVSNTQALAVTFDGGSTFKPTSNTNTLTETPDDVTLTVQARVTLSRYTDSAPSGSPKTGNNGQVMDDYELKIDTNSRTVVDGLELSRNHFDNLQQLHDYGGDWQWTIEHDAQDVANITVQSYQTGAVTKAKPKAFEDPISENAEVQAEAYYNRIDVQGGLRPDGTRPLAVAIDQTAESNDGRTISPGILRDPKITTDSGAIFRANNLLETAQSNNELVGEKTLPSDTLLNPGYQYPVDFGNGDVDKTLEEVSLTESPDSVDIRASFSTPRSDLSAQIEDLRRQGRDRGDNV